jgi:hypothetical protein
MQLPLWLPVKRGRHLVRKFSKSEVSFGSVIFWPWLYLRFGVRHLAAFVAGVGLFWYVGRALFGFSLLDGTREIPNLHGPFRYWGLLITLSLAIACWSVGGTAMYLLFRVWKWSRVYAAGGK